MSPPLEVATADRIRTNFGKVCELENVIIYIKFKGNPHNIIVTLTEV